MQLDVPRTPGIDRLHELGRRTRDKKDQASASRPIERGPKQGCCGRIVRGDPGTEHWVRGIEARDQEAEEVAPFIFVYLDFPAAGFPA